MALGASVQLRRGDQIREISLVDLYTGPGETCLLDGEVLLTVSLDAAALTRPAAFRKLQLWSGDFAVASAAVSSAIDDQGVWHDVRVCLGAVAPTPWRARATESRAEGVAVTPTLLEGWVAEELAQVSHPLPGNEWKLAVVPPLVRRAAEGALTNRDQGPVVNSSL
jgi:CO/xanthine dehydrogenase FAD-binding subunit